jgi:hypothetical protein
MRPVDRLKDAPSRLCPGSHLRQVFIDRATAKALLKATKNRASRNALRIALDDGSEPARLWLDDRNRLVDELLTAPKE